MTSYDMVIGSVSLFNGCLIAVGKYDW